MERSILQVHLRAAIFCSFIMIAALSLCLGCGGGGAAGVGGGGTPTPSPTPTPTPPTGAAAVELKVGDATVPPGGIFQYQLLLTEPKPIGNSSARPSFPGGATGPVRGVAVNDASGQAAGIAVIDSGNVSVRLISPNGTLGTDATYPIFTMTMPVNSTGLTAGQVFPATLDGANSLFVDGSGQSYTQTITPGSLTIGGAGAQSITDVIPGGGLLPDRSTLKILGQNFTANTRISIEGTNIIFPGPDTKFVSPNEIDVVLCNGNAVPDTATSCPGTGATFQLDGERVRAINKDTNVTVEYFSYIRTADVKGTSANSLVTEAHPMFSRKTYSVATFPYSVDATHFNGLALQNASSVDATFNVELLDANGLALPSAADGVLLPAGQKMTRDIQDFIPGPSPGAKTIRVSVVTGPSNGLQMLGMVGDTAARTITPVIVNAP